MERDFAQRQAQYILVGTKPGANVGQVKARVERILDARYPTAEIVAKDGFKDTQTKWVNGILSFFYVLLSLSVIVSFFAIVASRPLASEGFSLSFPVGTLLLLLVLAAVAGMVAAIGPARRAARLDVLKAVAYE